MSREHAQIKLAIWADDEFRDLSPGAQHLYFVLLTSPALSYCGVTDWRPKRIAAAANGWTATDVEQAAKELADRLYLVVDDDTEEVLIRSFLRNDGLMARERMATAMAKAYSTVASPRLRGVLVHELKRLHSEQPSLTGWSSERAVELLSKPSVDPSAMASVMALTTAPAMPSAEPLAMALPMETVMDPPTPSSLLLAPAPSSLLPPVPTVPAETPNELSGRKRPATRMPPGWNPSENHRKYAAEHGIDLSHEERQFREWVKSKDQRYANWNSGFSTWLGNTKKWATPGRGAKPPWQHHDPTTGRAVER